MILSPYQIATCQPEESVDFEWSVEESRLVRVRACAELPTTGFQVQIVRDLLDAQCEAELVHQIEEGGTWIPSQSGRRKQDFGPKVGFKKRKLRADGFSGFPPYSRDLYERVCQACSELAGFAASEMAVLEYAQDRGACIDYHTDDCWVWGDRIVIVSLLADAAMRFRQAGCVVRVPLPRRSALVISGEARRAWQHAILRSELGGKRRISVTFRELSLELIRDSSFALAVAQLDRLALKQEQTGALRGARPLSCVAREQRESLATSGSGPGQSDKQVCGRGGHTAVIVLWQGARVGAAVAILAACLRVCMAWSRHRSR